MIKTTAIVAVALIATLAQADAGRRHHHHQHYVRGGGFISAPVHMYSGYNGYSGYYGGRIGPGPLWAGPNECWTDEGYGRYAPCSGRSTR